MPPSHDETFTFEERCSDSPFVENIWRTQSHTPVPFTSTAETHWEMVITQQHGQSSFTIRGPETQASLADTPPDATFFGIVFKLGTFMPFLPIKTLLNTGITLPEAHANSFWLHGSTWQLPDYDNADTFVDRLIRQDLLRRDPIVAAVLGGQAPDLSLRAVQLRFLHTTGLSHKTIQQIERAQQAADCLAQGRPIVDTAYEAGYFDQAHLSKALKRFLGQTPRQITGLSRSE